MANMHPEQNSFGGFESFGWTHPQQQQQQQEQEHLQLQQQQQYQQQYQQQQYQYQQQQQSWTFDPISAQQNVYFPAQFESFPAVGEHDMLPQAFQFHPSCFPVLDGISNSPQFPTPTCNISTIISVCANISERISLIEQNVKALHSQLMSSKPSQSTCAPIDPISSLPSTLVLRVQDLRPTFYADHDMPPFTIQVFDTATNEVFLPTSGWRVEIHLYDGFGGNVNHKLHGNKVCSLTQGAVSVSGLRFLEVSAKNGNFFSMDCRLIFPRSAANIVAPLRPQRLVIYSSRLYHSHKAALRLKPSDPIHKLPNIGLEYSQRFSALGIASISDLATLPIELSPEAAIERSQILSSLRSEKGGCNLTEEKLVLCVQMARAVVSGEGVGQWLRGMPMTLSLSSSSLASSSSSSFSCPLSPASSSISLESISSSSSNNNNNNTGSSKSRKRKLGGVVEEVELDCVPQLLLAEPHNTLQK